MNNENKLTATAEAKDAGAKFWNDNIVPLEDQLSSIMEEVKAEFKSLRTGSEESDQKIWQNLLEKHQAIEPMEALFAAKNEWAKYNS